MVADEPLGATPNKITSVNRMYMHVYRCTIGLFYIHCTCRAKKANFGVLTCTVHDIHVHCTNVPVHVPCTCCILAESVRVTSVLTDPVAVEVVAQAAVCEPEGVKEVPVVVEEALGVGE